MFDSTPHSNSYLKENVAAPPSNANNAPLEYSKCASALTLDSASYSIPKKSSFKTLIFDCMKENNMSDEDACNEIISCLTDAEFLNGIIDRIKLFFSRKCFSVS